MRLSRVLQILLVGVVGSGRSGPLPPVNGTFWAEGVLLVVDDGTLVENAIRVQ